MEDLAEHASQTASRARELSYYYYHIPSISGVYFHMIDFLKEADSKIPNLAGLKYTYEDFMDIQLCKEFKDGKYDILYGRDETLLCALALGFRGRDWQYLQYHGSPLYSADRGFRLG